MACLTDRSPCISLTMQQIKYVWRFDLADMEVQLHRVHLTHFIVLMDDLLLTRQLFIRFYFGEMPDASHQSPSESV